ncbi:MAG TPA: mannose-1-phosphate guanylyltransferase/mannose-6-phosphate isomerase [Candidatus Moranbacteria bacterium]|nr:mannose-1-phosphate guanylyltransferase/mannose-6-phosphate isomerase [Candidatus Moranbacteria bacterium]
MYGIILCGGSGTRLWPLSRKSFPKQFLRLYSDKSLLQETFLRTQKIMPSKNIFFITNKDNYFNVFDQIEEVYPELEKEQIIIEPGQLNTAPAIALSIKYLTEKKGVNSDDPIIILPSDHDVRETDAFIQLIKIATEKASDNIGTIGITPKTPETGYGYIHKGEKIGSYYKVSQFKEKPDQETAEKYIATGDYVWNSGIYILNEKTFSEELQKYAPEIYKYYSRGYEEFIQNFLKLPSISIDFAITEKSQKVIVFEGNFGWSDISSFDALSDIAQEKNIDTKNHLLFNSKNIFIHSATNRLVAASDVDDLIIVENDDCILVQRKGKSDDVEKVTDYLKTHNYREIDHNIMGYRPWGKYKVLVDEENHKVKKLIVYPGASLSLQSHNHRSEHWIVVRGIAKVINGDREIELHENESTYIPATNKHRLSNPGKTELEIIEVQTGNYFEEDDIIRYEDIYNRIEQ